MPRLNKSKINKAKNHSIKSGKYFTWEGALKDLKLTSVELQHKLK